jgi:hypothetical protein
MSTIKKREELILATTEAEREDVDSLNALVIAEASPNRFNVMSLFFGDQEEDGVRIEEDLELGEITVQYFNDTETVELTEGVMYNWAMEFYSNNW